jgi:hypothetical protein
MIPEDLLTAKSADEEKRSISNYVTSTHHDPAMGVDGIRREDNVLLAKLGYRAEFKREFSVSPLHDVWSNVLMRAQLVETVAFAFSIMGVVASVSSTFSFPLFCG